MANQSGRDSIRGFTSTTHHDTYPLISPTKTTLKGRHALITGASKGIGRAISVSYAAAGASTIVLVARSSCDDTKAALLAAAKESNHPDPNILTIACDTTSQKDVEAAAKEVQSQVGKLDILINNAGYLENWVNIADSDPEDWWKSWEVNIKGTYLMARSFIPLLLQTESGSKTIINVSSMGGISCRAGASAYQSSKMAEIRLAMSFAADYEKEGLLAYSLHPGGVETGLAMGMPKDMHGILTDTPELAGDTIVYLTSERKEWLNGRFLSVGWDMEQFEKRKDEIVEKDLLKFRMMG